MKISLTRQKTIKVSVPAIKPTITDVPKFVPQGLISADDGNALTTGTDDKLFVADDTTDYLAHYILAKS